LSASRLAEVATNRTVCTSKEAMTAAYSSIAAKTRTSASSASLPVRSTP
jgi:hypothetical protein